MPDREPHILSSSPVPIPASTNYVTQRPTQRGAPRPPNAGTNESLVGRANAHEAGSAGPHPFNTLPADLAAFCALGVDQYASCVTYCHKRSGLWTDANRLPLVARQLLQRGDEDTARQVVSRFLMLTVSARNAPTLKGRLEWLAKLHTDEGRREEFEALCSKTLASLQSDQESSSRASQAQQPISGTRHTQNANAVTSTSTRGGRRPSNQSAVSTSSAHKPSIENTDTLRPLPTHFRPPRPTPSDVSDIDSVPGGMAMLGQSGPKTAILSDWPLSVQDLLNKEYKVHRGDKAIQKVFSFGSLVAVFWHDNVGHSFKVPEKYSQVAQQPVAQKLGKGFLSLGPKGESIYSHVKRFVLLEKRDGHSIGIPVTSYSNQGLTAKKLSEREQRAHAIIYAYGQSPVSLPDEPEFSKDPICVRMVAHGETLSKQSRLYYAKPQSIDHNIKVKHLGYVIEQHQPRLLSAFQNELLGTDE